MSEKTLPPPPMMWAQRTEVVFVTINLEDVKDPDIKFTKDSLYFKGVGGLEKKQYEVTIPLYEEIEPDKCKIFNKGRFIELILAKARKVDDFWPSLTKEQKKYHWLKCDFNKWQDEDDSGNEGLDEMGGGGGGGGGMGGGDFEQLMRQMGGLGGAGAGGKPSLNDLDDDEGPDSDDEPIPDLE